MKVTFIGGGMMGGAMAKAMLAQKAIAPADLTIADLHPETLGDFEKQGVNITADNVTALENANIVMVAVKPQVLPEVLKPLADYVPQNAVVVSIAAGITVQTIQDLLNHNAVVRVMPNLPTLLSEGMSGWFATPEVTSAQKAMIQTLLNSCGKEIQVTTEDNIDAVTALSGSGPAYVYLFLQSLIKGGVKLGLTETEAEKSALQTVLGGVKLAENADEDLETLIGNVACNGGTTEMAIRKFRELKFPETVEASMQAAYDRAKELAQ